MIRVSGVKTLRKYRLLVAFSDSTSGEADLKRLVAREPFTALKNRDVFELAHVAEGAVVWNDDLDISTETLYALVHKLPRPRTLEDAKKNETRVSLRELRKRSGVTQHELAARLHIEQSQVSRLERQDAMLVTTLNDYVSALGGVLEISAKIGRKRVLLQF